MPAKDDLQRAFLELTSQGEIGHGEADTGLDSAWLRRNVPELELSRGSIVCLHVPVGLDCRRVADAIAELASQEEKTALFCDHTTIWRGGARGFLRPRTSTKWLSRAAGLSVEEATAVIRRFSSHVPDRLSTCAATPTCFLAIAAAVLKNPDILIYSTVGLDPLGCRAIHEYVGSYCRHLCVVYLSGAVEVGGQPPAHVDCPDNAECVILRRPEA